MGAIVPVVKGIVRFRDKYLIIKRDDKDEIGAGTWEFPGGKIEFGESPENALIREAKEETGLDISINKLLYAATFMTNPLRQVIILAYQCSALHDKIELSFEHSDYLWACKKQLEEKLADGILADMNKYNVFDILE